MRLRAWIAACALASTPGCALWGSRAVALPPDDPALRAALAQVEHAAESRRSLRAVGQLRLASRLARGGGVREIVLAEHPDHLRLESQGPLGQALALLVSNGERFTWFDGEQLESGPVDPRLLRERLGLDFEPAEAVAVLLASPPAAGLPRSAHRRADQTVVRLDGWRLGIGPGGELSALEALDAAGEVRWRARYDAWRDVPGGRYPSLLRVEFPGTGASARLELHHVELNAALDPVLFRGPHDR
jgi:hypothetical protein